MLKKIIFICLFSLFYTQNIFANDFHETLINEGFKYNVLIENIEEITKYSKQNLYIETNIPIENKIYDNDFSFWVLFKDSKNIQYFSIWYINNKNVEKMEIDKAFLNDYTIFLKYHNLINKEINKRLK